MAKHCYLQPILTDATKTITSHLNFDKTSTSAITIIPPCWQI